MFNMQTWSKWTILSKLIFLICIRNQYLTIASVRYNRLKKQLHEYFHLYHFLKRTYNFRRNFIFNILILKIVSIFKCGKLLLKIYTVMLYIVFSLPFWISFKPDAKLQTQGSTDALIHYREKLNTSVDDLQRSRKWNVFTERLMKNIKMELLFRTHWST